MNEETYAQGRAMRLLGKGIGFCPYPKLDQGAPNWQGRMQRRISWLAGWNDTDMELNKSEQGLRKTEAV